MSLHKKWFLHHQLPSSLQSCSLRTARLNQKTYLHVGAQSYKDEGRSRSIVDENLLILRKRIEEVRIKERLERCCLSNELGWNYAPVYDDKHKKEVKLLELFKIIGLVGGTFSVTLLGGTLCLCLASLLVHFNH